MRLENLFIGFLFVILSNLFITLVLSHSHQDQGDEIHQHRNQHKHLHHAHHHHHHARFNSIDGESSLGDMVPAKNYETLLKDKIPLSYIWRQDVDFPHQPTTMNMFIKHYIWKSSESDYIVFQSNEVLWQNRNFKTDSNQLVNWKARPLQHDKVCVNSPQYFGFQKMKIRVGYDKGKIENFLNRRSKESGGKLVVSYCGNFNEIFEVLNNNSNSAQSNNNENNENVEDLEDDEVNNILFSSHANLPNYWDSFFQDLQGTFLYRDHFVNTEHPHTIMKNIVQNNELSSEFRNHATDFQSKTHFEFSCVYHFKNVKRISLPFGFELTWYGYSHFLDKPMEAKSDWNISSILDIPLEDIINNPGKYNGTRSYNSKPFVVTSPMFSHQFECQK